MQWIWLVVLSAVLIGHGGLFVAAYNRLNGCGIPRRTIKLIVWVMLWFTVLLPFVVAYAFRDSLLHTWHGPSLELPTPVLMYASICLLSWLLLGIPWLMWRPIFRLEWADAARQSEIVDVESALNRRLALTTQCQWESRLPLNQIFELSVDRIELPVVGLPKSLDGYRIAHVSDIHLTGHVHPDYTRFVMEQANSWQPELIALTGDIIDSQRCIDWIPGIFSCASAPDGCFYVLGNHDTRVVDSMMTRHAMDNAGWTDLGSRTFPWKLRHEPVLLIGNEYPWYRRPHDLEPNRLEPNDNSTPMRFMLSHSPDQITWARRHGVKLMLAGHTHGGQGRIPLVGPILSPSRHGSRFASGSFYKAPTTMHVTRGLSGTHLLRINCRPELSLLTLRSTSVDRTERSLEPISR